MTFFAPSSQHISNSFLTLGLLFNKCWRAKYVYKQAENNDFFEKMFKKDLQNQNREFKNSKTSLSSKQKYIMHTLIVEYVLEAFACSAG